MATAKRKPTPPSPRKPVDVAAAFQTHPKITLATIGTIIAILAAIGPGVFWAINYYVSHSEFNAYQKHTATTLAWRDVQAIRTEAVVARNRVNDCELLKERGRGMTPLERATCAQYQAELDDANRRFVEARTLAAEASKEKQ